MKKIPLLFLLFVPFFLLTCKKKTVEELSLDDIIKQQEEYYRSLPDWQKLRYKGKDQASLVYGIKGKIKSLDEKQINRPSGGWNSDATEISTWEKHYEFDREGRIMKFQHFENVNDGTKVFKDSLVILVGDTIKEIRNSIDYGNITSTKKFEYFPSGNFQRITTLKMDKNETKPYSREDVIYTYDEKNNLINKRWITFKPSEDNYNNTEYFQSIDTTFNVKGYPEKSYLVEYQYGTTPNDTIKITRIEFVYDNKNQLIKVIIDDITEESVTNPLRVNQLSILPSTKELTPQKKTEYKNYDSNGNWTEMWVYSNDVSEGPMYKIRRYKTTYHE